MHVDHSLPAKNEQPDKPMRNIVLIGFMGCGKSTIGRMLHNKLGFKHLDTDQMIEEKEGRPISDIFSNEGEDHFRDLETGLLRDMVNSSMASSIISTGGGMIIREENQQLLRELGFVVWLSCTPETIYKRTSRSGHRPLLQGEDPMAAINQLLSLRTPMYQTTAHIEIKTSELDFDEIACGIRESACYHFSHLSENS